MSIWSKIKEFFKSESTHKQYIINYKAGRYDRTLESLEISNISADEDIRRYGEVIRGRSRTLVKDSPIFAKYVSNLVKYVVGAEGFKLQVKAKNTDGSFDTIANDVIENEFEQQWGYECDIREEFTFYEIQCLAISALARDGECFIRLHKNYQRNKYKFAIELIEADALPYVNKNLSNGNVVKLGIERDKLGRRVNYWFYANKTYTIVPAKSVIHFFLPARIGQSRGIPLTHASIYTAAQLNDYIEAAVINARVGAAKMGFIEREEISGSIDTLGTEKINSVLYEKVEPGAISILPVGMKYKAHDPKYPDAQFETFVKAMTKHIASGMDMSYASLTSDLSEANYSSMRGGMLDERETYKRIQKLFIVKVLNKIYEEWLDNALMVGAIKVGNGVLTYDKLWKFLDYEFVPRGWDWVDPKSDIEADISAVMAGFMSWREVAAKRGKNLEDIAREIAEDNKIFAKYGITPVMGKTEAAIIRGGKNDSSKQNS